MNEQIRLLRQDERTPGSGRSSPALPPDLQDQVRGRVRLVAILLLIAFAVDPFFFAVTWLGASVSGRPLPPTFWAGGRFAGLSLTAAVGSATVWFVARSARVSAAHLLTLGAAYEVIVCLIIALSTFWQFYLDNGVLPNTTWIPAVVILFPLIMPGPPRRMLIGSIAAGAMAPLGLGLLDVWNKVPANADAYTSATVQSSLAVLFAYLGARVIYGLGRQVAAARELGSYRLEQKLGHGGMGEVWRARHRMLARPAAIKLIRSAPEGEPSDEVRRRFEREAQVTAGLRSPHTVELFDFGVSAEGAFYYVMELLDGLDVDTLVRRFGPVPASRAVHVLRQMCHSLSEAHAQGVIHRDIKPANIFLCRYGEERDFVKVLDFGLVSAGREPAGAPLMTRENAIHGTPAFIAPEQALGRSDLDGRVDIYASGCVAYWLLTGHLVFEGRTHLEMIMHHVHTPPIPPSARTELPIPAALERVVLSCLAKQPGERPSSARDLAASLGDVNGGGTWSEAQARDWWNKHQPDKAVT